MIDRAPYIYTLQCLMLACVCPFVLSSESGDGLIDHGKSVTTVLEVDSLPLVVQILLVVDCTMDNRGDHVDHKENGDGREDNTHEIARQALIDHTVALKTAPGVPQTLVVGRGCEWCLLLAETWDVKVDTSAQLCLDFKPFDHLDDLTLLLVNDTVVGTILPQVLVDIVLHITITLLFITN